MKIWKFFSGLLYIIETQKVLDLRINLKASYIIVPQNGIFSSMSNLLLLDLGHLKVCTHNIYVKWFRMFLCLKMHFYFCTVWIYWVYFWRFMFFEGRAAEGREKETLLHALPQRQQLGSAQVKAGTPPGSPVCVWDPSTWVVFGCLTWHISRKLDLKQSNWDLNQLSNGMCVQSCSLTSCAVILTSVCWFLNLW